MKTDRAIRLIVVSLLVLSLSSAQPGGERQRPDQLRPPVAFEAIPVYTGTPPSPAVNVHYRIGEDFFVFVRGDVRGQFATDGEMVFELFNDSDVSVARSIKLVNQVRLGAATAATAGKDLEGAITLSVPPGRYTLLVNIEDRKSGRSFLDKNTKVEVKALPSSGLEIVSMFFAAPLRTGSDSLAPAFRAFNRGPDILFGSPPGSGALVQVASDSPLTAITAEWELVNTPDHSGETALTFTGTTVERYTGILLLDSLSVHVGYRVASAGPQWATLFIPLPLEKLESGKCSVSINLTVDSVKKAHRANFRVFWDLKPQSLGDLNLAIDALRHIIDENEMENLFSVSRDERSRNFAEFWHSRDKDTSTAYNEHMAEYYRRVDMAIRNYSTTNEADGYKTDRGRIFILYGAPTDTQRILEPGEPPREVWTYRDLRQRFVFADSYRNGMYALKEVQKL